MYKSRKVFTALKMNIMIEALKVIGDELFYA